MHKLNLLVNLPPGFFTSPSLKAVFSRLAKLGKVRKTSHNTPEEIAPDLAWAEAVIMWAWPLLDDAMLDASARLRYIGYLDLSQRQAQIVLRRKLPVSVARHGFSPAVAEMALGLILASLRRFGDYHAMMRSGTEPWVKDFPTDIDPMERELTGRTVGIVGLGQVGGRLRELLSPFRCNVQVFDPYLPDKVASAQHVEKVDLKRLVKTSDVVVLCAASNAGTKNLLDAKLIRAMRPGTALVNVARAALVDTAALIERLKQGDLVAAIDVFDQEPLPQDHLLRTAPNALLTPHRAGGLMSSVERILNWLIDDLENVTAGLPQKYAVTESMISRLDA